MRSIHRTWLALVAVACGVTLRPAPLDAQASAADSVGVVTARVQPETVTVGQPFTLRLRAIAPRGRTAQAPAVPDTGGLVEALDPAFPTRRGDTLLVRYRLIAWQPGVLTVPLGPVLMRRGPNEVSVPFDARIVVRSVLPADSADRVPKPPRDLLLKPPAWWERWWQWALGLLALVALVFLLERWRTRRRERREAVRTPIERAEAAFTRLDARGLPAIGEGARHVALAAEITRQYLADIHTSLSLALTSTELVAAIREVPALPDRQVAQFLRRVDAVRFGGTEPSASVVQSVSGQARELVREIERLRVSAVERAA